MQHRSHNFYSLLQLGRAIAMCGAPVVPREGAVSEKTVKNASGVTKPPRTHHDSLSLATHPGGASPTAPCSTLSLNSQTHTHGHKTAILQRPITAVVVDDDFWPMIQQHRSWLTAAGFDWLDTHAQTRGVWLTAPQGEHRRKFSLSFSRPRLHARGAADEARE